MTEKMSKRILEAARLQQEEEDAMGSSRGAAGGRPAARTASASAGESSSNSSSRQALAQQAARGLKKPMGARALEDDDDGDEEDGVSEDDDDYDADEVELDQDDERLLSQFMPASAATQRTLADLIMDKIREKEAGGSSGGAAAAAAAMDDQTDAVARQLVCFLVTLFSSSPNASISPKGKVISQKFPRKQCDLFECLLIAHAIYAIACSCLCASRHVCASKHRRVNTRFTVERLF
jgi:hypothetical protein